MPFAPSFSTRPQAPGLYPSLTITQNFDAFNGNQPGDAVKGVQRIVGVVKGENGAASKPWPGSLLLGFDAVSIIREKLEKALRDLSAWEDSARSTDI